MRIRVPVELRRAVWLRARARCEYCGAIEECSPVGFHCEHIIAVQHGGATTLDNLAVSCPACNFRKGTNLSAIDPDTGGIVAVFHPRRDRWADHFKITGSRVEPRNATGRATAALLDFNVPERLAARELEMALLKNRPVT